jgi:S1-C subfamily serine protease
MRLDGVKEDRPAQKAGIEKGDIVIKMGEYEVKTMMNYMECLGKFEVGQTVEVTVLRNGNTVIKTVTF